MRMQYGIMIIRRRRGRCFISCGTDVQTGTTCTSCRAARDIPLDVCWSSPLVRARETAEIVLRGRSIPIHTDDRLKEMSFGEYEGLENSFSIPDCPINVLFREPEKYVSSVGGAETFAELFARTGSFLREVAEPLVRDGRNVLIVGHGAMNLSIISQVRHLPIEDFWSPGIENCRMIRLL